MTEHGSFYRKITYLVLIAVLLFPISYLGAPATNEVEGGRLAQLRAEHDLGQSDLGDIDPASETIRLATLGLRGVAVSMLWSKANEYKKKEDWTNFRATLSQLSKLQPYFIKFWQYQAWNLTYNVSVELDDVRDRFHYVKRGIEFLKKGISYNRDSPYLLSELGWFIGNKIGKADEHKEYRRLFKNDDDFHPPTRPPEKRDNWLVSRSWYETSRSVVEKDASKIGQKNPVIFFSDPARAQINYSEAIEKEGTFGEKARSAWATASKMWDDFGKLDIKSSQGFNIKVGTIGKLAEETEALEKKLAQLSPSAIEKAIKEKRASLTAEEVAVLELPEEGLTDEQSMQKYEAASKLLVQPTDVAALIARETPELAAEARRLASRIVSNTAKMRLARNNNEVVNYDYWAIRCNLEQTPEALRARELAYTARRVFKNDADLLQARELFEESFDEWAKVFRDFPELPFDSVTGSDIMEYVEQYATLLQQLDLNLVDEEVGRNFPLWAVVEANDMSGIYAKAAGKYLRNETVTNGDESTDDAGAQDGPAAVDEPVEEDALSSDVEAAEPATPAAANE
ncbi:MAG: hypothetical protein AAGD11_14645 [Planctomycetota bacterium]